MADEPTLADLIPYYPPAGEPDIAADIAKKWEFAQLGQCGVRDRINGIFFPHQEMAGRLMVALDRMLFFHRTGTGKTISFCRIAEYFRGRMKRAYVITRSEQQIDIFINQITQVCVPGLGMRSRKDLRDYFYTFDTHAKFAGLVGGMTDDQVVETFSDCLIFVDEAQFLHAERPDADEDGGAESGQRSKRDADPPTQQPRDQSQKRRNVYAQFVRLFGLAKRSKLMLATATPMIDDYRHIGSLLTLLADRPISVGDGARDIPATLEALRPILTGKVSFMRELMSNVRIENMGTPHVFELAPDVDGESAVTLDTDSISLNLYASQMQMRQAYAYVRARLYEASGTPPDEIGEPLAEGVRISDFQAFVDHYGEEVDDLPGLEAALPVSQTQAPGLSYQHSQQALNFVFPDGSFGKAGFDRYMNRPASGGQPDVFSPTSEFRTAYLRQTPEGDIDVPGTLDTIEESSVKFATTIRKCINGRGKCFVYCDAVMGSGVHVLAACFEMVGFLRAFGSETTYARRFALVEGKSPAWRPLLERFNSAENIDGDIIKVFIVSRVGQIGLSLTDCVQIHIVTSWWNLNSIYQAMSRAIRATSHDLLIERARLTRPDNPVVTIQLYEHIAVMPKTPDPAFDILAGRSIDLYSYELAVYKEVHIKHVERILKQCAVDCIVLHHFNVLEGDQQFTSECDYKLDCNYACAVDHIPPAFEVHGAQYVVAHPEMLDFSTADLLYADEDIADALRQLQELFRQMPVWTFAALLDAVRTTPARRPLVVLQALERAVSEHALFRDRYGFPAFLRGAGNLFYIVRDYPVTTAGELGQTVPATGDIPLVQALPIELVAPSGGTIEAVLALNPADSDFRAAFHREVQTLSGENQMLLLEQSMIRQARGAEQPIDAEIAELFRYFIHRVADQSDVVAQQKSRKTERGRARSSARRGRRPSAQLPPAEQQQRPQLIIHTFKGPMKSAAYGYGGVSNFINPKELRILRPPYEQWQDATAGESDVYGRIIAERVSTWLARYKEGQVYVLVLYDGKIRIADSRPTDAAGKRGSSTRKKQNGKEDARKQKRGRECANMGLSTLGEYVDFLKDKYGDDSTYPAAVIDEINSLPKSGETGVTAAVICHRLYNVFQSLGLVFCAWAPTCPARFASALDGPLTETVNQPAPRR